MKRTTGEFDESSHDLSLKDALYTRSFVNTASKREEKERKNSRLPKIDEL